MQLRLLGNSLKTFDYLIKTGTGTNLLYAASLKGLSTQTKINIVAQTGFNTSQKMGILASAGLTSEELKQAASTKALSISQANTARSTNMLSYTFQNLATKLGISTTKLGILAGGVAVLGVAVMAYKSYAQAQEAARQKAEESAQSYRDTASSISDYTAKYQELHTALINAQGSEEETYNIKKQLLDLQTELNDKYGAEYGHLNLVTDAYRDQTAAIQEYNRVAAEKFLNENNGKINDAEKHMTRNKHYMLSSTDIPLFDEKGQALQEIISQYEKDGISLMQNIDGTTGTIFLNADPQSAQETINNFMSDLREKAKELGNEHLFDDVLEMSGSSLKNANETIDEWGEIYKQSQFAKIATDFDLAKTYDEARAAAKKYNEAVLKSSNIFEDSAVTKAKEELDSYKDKLSTDEWKEFPNAVKDVFDIADTSLLDFNDAVNENKDGLGNLVKDIKNMDLDDVDFMSRLSNKDETFVKLKDSANDYGLTIQELMDYLVQFQVIQEGVQNANLEPKVSFEQAKSEAEAFAKSFDSINELLSSQKTGSSLTLEEFNSSAAKEYASAIEYVNGTIQLNEEKVQSLAKAKSEETLATIEAADAQAKSDYLKNSKEIDKLIQQLNEKKAAGDEDTDSIKKNIQSLRDQQSSLVEQCDQYSLMAANIREATGSYQEWINSQNGPESGDMYRDAQKAMEAIKEGLQTGKTGTNKFNAAVEVLIPDDIPEAEVHKYVEKLNRYLKDSDKGTDNFLSDSVKNGLLTLENGVYQSVDGITMQDFVDKLKITPEMAQAIFGELEEYNLNISFGESLSEDIFDNDVRIAQIKQELEELNIDPTVNDEQIQALSNELELLLQKKNKLNEQVTINIHSQIELDQQLNEAKTKLDEMYETDSEGQKVLKPEVDTTELNAAIKKVAELEQQKEKLGTPTEVEVNAYIESANQTILDLETKIEELEGSNINFSVNTQAADELEALREKLQETKDNLSQVQITYGSNASEEEGKAQSLYDILAKIPESINTAISVNADTAINTTRSLVNLLKQITDKESKITVTKTTVNQTVDRGSSPAQVNGSAHVNGTVTMQHAYGKALADGSWGVKQGGTALVGELGTEIIVNPSTGHWHTVGDNGAEFTHVPKGAIVFNHLQSKALLERGFVNGRGTALVNGTTQTKGTALANGTAFIGGISNDTISISGSKGGNYVTSKSKGTAKAAKETTKALKKTKKESEETANAIDWVAQSIENLEHELEMLRSSLDTLPFEQQIETLNIIIQKQKEFTSACEQAQKTYREEWEKSASLISEDYQNKIMGGATFSIESIGDEKLYKKIEDAQDKWKQLQTATKDTNEATKTYIETLKELYEAETKPLDAGIQTLDNKIQNVQNKIDNLDTINQSASLDDYESMIHYSKQEQAYYRLKLSNAIKYQNTLERNTDEYYEAAQAIQECRDSISQCTQNQLQWQQTMLELPLKQLERTNDELDRSISKYEKLKDNKDSAISAAIDIISDRREEIEQEIDDITEYYDKQINALKDESDELDRILTTEQKLAALRKAQEQKTNKVLVNGEWTWQANADDINKAYKDYSDQLVDNQIDALEKEKDRATEKLQANIDELDDYQKKWEEISEAFEKEQNRMMLAAEYGLNIDQLKEQILNKNLGLVDQMSQRYNTIELKLDDLQRHRDENEALIQSIEDYITAWQDGEIEIEDAKDYIQEILDDNEIELSSMDERVWAVDNYSANWGQTAQEVGASLNQLQSAEILAKDNEQVTLTERVENLTNYSTKFNEIIMALVTQFDTNMNNMLDKLASSADKAEELAKRIADAMREANSARDDDDDSSSSKSSSSSSNRGPGGSSSGYVNSGPGVVKRHNGIYGGYVGSTGMSNDKILNKLKEYVAIKDFPPIESNEQMALLLKDELVLNKIQQNNLVHNIAGLESVTKANQALGSLNMAKQSQVVDQSMHIDKIEINEVEKPGEIAKAIQSGILQQAALKAMYRK